MSERLRSVGLDVGTTSTQMILSELTVENRASTFAVPELEITGRKILYRSPVYLTPLVSDSLVDGDKLREILEKEYAAAGITREDVDTGAVIITGETSRKENAGTVLEALSDFAGDFVVATAGPDLESVLAARGAGAVILSKETGKTVVHMDIGGGTSNLALIREGELLATGCMNVGGRLIKYDKTRKITYVSSVLDGLCSWKVGDFVTDSGMTALTEQLVQALEMAAGQRPRGELFRRLWTAECDLDWPEIPEDAVISFSGGVADCIEKTLEPDAFGDLGPVLGKAIWQSSLCAGKYVLGRETIRATVIGAGCHSAQLSGSTVFYRNTDFPLKNLPVVRMQEQDQSLPTKTLADRIRQQLRRQDKTAILALPGLRAPGYEQIKTLAKAIVRGFDGAPVLVALEQDMAKALGQAMAMEQPLDAACLCIDRVRLREGDYLDVGVPVGPALPVVIKTLILNR